MLKPENFIPIDVNKVKIERDKIYNVPNSMWNKIELDIKTINDVSLPYTLRTFLLNHLPYCVVILLKEKQRKRDFDDIGVCGYDGGDFYKD